MVEFVQEFLPSTTVTASCNSTTYNIWFSALSFCVLYLLKDTCNLLYFLCLLTSDLYVKEYRPPNFTPEKKYAVLFSV